MLRITLALFVFFAGFARAQDAPKQDTQPPKVVNAPAPDIQHCSSLKPGETMSVTVRLDVTVEGLPDAVAVEHGSGDQCIDDDAVVAVQRYRFRPATRSGKPVRSHIRVQVDFKGLQGK
jgi:periplasmic protein TonB